MTFTFGNKVQKAIFKIHGMALMEINPIQVYTFENYS